MMVARDQGGGYGGEEWSVSGSVLKVNLSRFADGVSMEYKRKR